MNKHYYKNLNGMDFDIEFLTAEVPPDADHFGYIIKVIAHDNPEMVHGYKAAINKSLCNTESAARMWLTTIALNSLKDILETYNNGKTSKNVIDPKGLWYIMGT